MSEVTNKEDLIAVQKKEKKELLAKTQKMKHSVPKGDKKKKKEVTAEITQLLADLDLRHEKELKEFDNLQDKEVPLESAERKIVEGIEVSAEKEKAITEGHIEKETGVAESQIEKEKVVAEGPTEKEKEVAEGPTEKEKEVAEGLTEKEKEVAESPTEKENQNNKVAPRLTKAQKRRNKKASLEKERSKAIAEQELENLNSLRNLESEDIKKKLSDRNLSIHEVPSDGNCLYKAVEHQLSFLKLKETTVESLRNDTSEYMLSHMNDYIPFLTSPETGDVLTEDQYLKYCEDIAKTPAWGGHIEVQVLSHICGFPIEVIQAQGPSIIAGDENSNPKLILSYHRHAYGLGEHFNSVIPSSA